MNKPYSITIRFKNKKINEIIFFSSVVFIFAASWCIVAFVLLPRSLIYNRSNSSTLKDTRVLKVSAIGSQNLSDLEQFKDYEQEWTIENVGSHEVFVYGYPSCGCIGTNLPNPNARSKTFKISPNESRTVFLKWRTGSRTGPFNQKMSVFINDEVQPLLNLTIKCIVYPPISTIPPDAILHFGHLQNNKIPVTLNLKIFSKKFDQLKIINVYTSNNKIFSTNIGEKANDLLNKINYQKISVTLNNVISDSHIIDEFLTIESNHPTSPIMKVPLRGFLMP